jgi:ABC-type bacteriocin/lantibiotic exporter with double-glycine peptidase domain
MDTGLSCLVALARFHQLPAESEQLAHQFGQQGKTFFDTGILQGAKALTRQSRRFKVKLDGLHSAMLPAIARAKDGSYFIPARIAREVPEDTRSPVKCALMHDVRTEAPVAMSPEQLTECRTGELRTLPLAYCEACQWGQNVARVRDLDALRNFITGPALTLVVDLFFVFAFIAVLWLYSPTLAWIVLATIPCCFALPVFITPILRHCLNVSLNTAISSSGLYLVSARKM